LARIALICPPFAAHVASFAALGEGLAARGHEPFFLLNAGAKVSARGLAVHRVPARKGDPAVSAVLKRAERPGGLLATLRTIADSAALTDQLCAGGLPLLRYLGAEMIVGDQTEPAAFLLAEALALPFCGIACAVQLDPAPGVPLPFLDWPYQPGEQAKLRRTVAIGDFLSKRQHEVIAHWCERFDIAPRRTLQECLGKHQIAQMVPAFDFPRPEPLPFVPVGPLRSADEQAALPFEPPGDRPLVFATFGTLLGGDLRLWRMLADACQQAGAALVIAHGGKLTDQDASGIDAHYVGAFLPYRDVMKEASLVITHGGSNTILDALACGVPLLVSPVGFDQPGNLARVRHHRLGEKLVSRRNADAVGKQIVRLIADDSTRRRCEEVAAAIADAGGVTRAVRLIEAQLR
jgi:zeaxanthin glucosyltransferase